VLRSLKRGQTAIVGTLDGVSVAYVHAVNISRRMDMDLSLTIVADEKIEESKTVHAENAIKMAVVDTL
jgi:hypothetical protein